MIYINWKEIDFDEEKLKTGSVTVRLTVERSDVQEMINLITCWMKLDGCLWSCGSGKDSNWALFRISSADSVFKLAFITW